MTTRRNFIRNSALGIAAVAAATPEASAMVDMTTTSDAAAMASLSAVPPVNRGAFCIVHKSE